MKTILKSLICSVLLTSLYFVANAQALPNSVRIGGGVEIASGISYFGTGSNSPQGGMIGTPYKYGVGASLRVDIPIFKKLYGTVSAGYANYFATSVAGASQQAILGTTPPNFKTIPLKLGVKAFAGDRFYFQAEFGETIFVNKTELYGIYSRTFTWSPGLGVVCPLKKPHTYIDAGIRFESFASFYNDSNTNGFWGLHAAYTFNL